MTRAAVGVIFWKMELTPTNWNVVVAGSWNPAIFTPLWVRKELLGLDEKVVLTVEVPLDNHRAPRRLVHSDFSICPGDERLQIFCLKNDTTVLDEAKKIATRAIGELEKTPLAAAGFNLRYEIASPANNIITLLDSEARFRITDQESPLDTVLRQAVSFSKGILNVEISYVEQSSVASINFNFHLSSNEPIKLKEWLSIDASVYNKKTDEILKKLLN